MANFVKLLRGGQETWVLNETINIASKFSFSASFVSNDTSYTGLKGELWVGAPRLSYTDSSGSTERVYIGGGYGGWADQAYRKLIFDAPPTGDLLTWLTVNGTKQ